MKHVNKVKLSLLLLCIILSNGVILSQTQSFYVYFKQDDNKIIINKAEVELLRKPFEVYVEYTEPLDLLVNSASEGKTYKQAKIGKLLFFMDAFNESKKPESFFLNKETINLSENEHTIWRKNETNGEKGLKTSDGRFKNYRKIEKLYSIKNQRIYKIEDFKKDLYLVFIYTIADRSGERLEIQRELVKIKWVEDFKENTKSYKRKKEADAKNKVREAEQNLKRKQKLEKKEEKILKKLDESKKNKGEKEKTDTEEKTITE